MNTKMRVFLVVAYFIGNKCKYLLYMIYNNVYVHVNSSAYSVYMYMYYVDTSVEL